MVPLSIATIAAMRKYERKLVKSSDLNRCIGLRILNRLKKLLLQSRIRIFQVVCKMNRIEARDARASKK